MIPQLERGDSFRRRDLLVVLNPREPFRENTCLMFAQVICKLGEGIFRCERVHEAEWLS